MIDYLDAQNSFDVVKKYNELTFSNNRNEVQLQSAMQVFSKREISEGQLSKQTKVDKSQKSREMHREVKVVSNKSKHIQKLSHS